MLKSSSTSVAGGMVLLFALFASPLGATDPLSPVGYWELATGESRYRISYCGTHNELCAELIWLREDARTDANVALMDRHVVYRASYDGGSSWSGLIAFSGRTYVATMTLVSKDAMQVSSCSGLLCQTYKLRRRSGQ